MHDHGNLNCEGNKIHPLLSFYEQPVYKKKEKRINIAPAFVLHHQYLKKYDW